MSREMLLVTIVLAGLLTYAIRLSFIVFLGSSPLPTWLQQSLQFVPVAVLSALISPELFSVSHPTASPFLNARLIAGVVAILVAWKTKNVLLTIIVGMACLLLLQLLIH